MKKFTDLQGKASKGGPERFKPQEGKNTIRIIAPIVPAYKYWLKTRDNNTSVPMDCLRFNRDTETFDNKLPDAVQEYDPTLKCSWAYMSYIIDRADGKLKLFDHKKKLFGAILDAAKKKYGDPTDPVKGWDVVFTKEKTGPAAFNVEYSLEIFEIETGVALTDEELKLIKEAEPIEAVTKLDTYEEQKAFIKNFIAPQDEPEDEVTEELETEEEEEIPF